MTAIRKDPNFAYSFSSESEYDTDDSSYRENSDTDDSESEVVDVLSNVSKERDEQELLQEIVEKQKELRAKEKSAHAYCKDDCVARRLNFDDCPTDAVEPPRKRTKKL